MALSDDFTSQFLGHPVEVEDPSNVDQCMDWAFAWCDKLRIPRAAIRHLFAYQAFTLPNDVTRQYFDIVVNSDAYVPPAGALAVFGTSLGVAGHIALVLSGSTQSNLRTSDQNWNFKPFIQVVNHAGYRGVLGFLVPKTNQGEAMIANSDNEYWRWNKLFVQIRGRNASRQEFINAAVGQSWLRALEILSDDAEADAATNAQAVGQVAVRDKWDQQIYGLQDALKAANDNLTSLQRQIADLTTRPTKEQLDALTAAVTDATKQANDAHAALVTAEAQQQADQATGNAFLRWLGDQLNKLLKKG